MTGNPSSSANVNIPLLHRYARYVEIYTRCFISNQTDYLHAFAGVESILKFISGTSLVWGLPMEILEHALIWEPSEGVELQPRECLHTHHFQDTLQLVQFSSWSWVGWIGRVKYDRLAWYLVPTMQPTHAWAYKSLEGDIRIIDNRSGGRLPNQDCSSQDSAPELSFSPADLPLGSARIPDDLCHLFDCRIEKQGNVFESNRLPSKSSVDRRLSYYTRQP